MSDVSNAADIGGDAPISVVSIEKDAAASSVHDAARALIDARKKRDEAAPVEKTEAAPEKSAEKADAAAPKEPTGETEATDPPEEAPLELPRSWTKDRAESWAKLDHDTQQMLLDHDRKATAEVRRVQNEAAEKLKGLTAKEQAVEQARQHYEQALPALQQTLQSQISGQFADIKSMADVEKMAAEDWPRYIQWDAAQKKLAAVSQEARAAQERQSAEAQTKAQAFNAEQDKLFLEKAPEMADKAHAAKVGETAVKVLKDIGFTDDELGALWNGAEKLSLRDHRAQLLIRDAIRYREAQAKAKAPAPKPVPQVQKPSDSRPRGAADSERTDALAEKLSKTGNIRDAAALLRARRAAAG